MFYRLLLYFSLSLEFKGTTPQDPDYEREECEEIRKTFKSDDMAKNIEISSLRNVLLFYPETEGRTAVWCTVIGLHNRGIRTTLTAHDKTVDQRRIAEETVPEDSAAYYLSETNGLNNRRSKLWKAGINNRNNFHNFRGEVLKVAVMPNAATILVNTTNGKHTIYGGAEFSLLDTLSKKLNFRYSAVIPSDGYFGSKLKNGSWSGIVGVVIRKEAHFALSMLTITEQRARVLDFSTAYEISPVTFITKAPGLRSKAFIVVRPFTLKVWLGVMAIYIISTLALDRLMMLETSYKNERQKLKLRNTFWYLFSLLVSQGSDSYKVTTVGWFLLFTWLLASFVLASSYSGTLISFISFPGHLPSIDTIDNLVRHVQEGKIRVGEVEGLAVYNTFQRSSNAMIKILAESMREGDNSKGYYMDQVKRVSEEEDFAFLIQAISFFQLTSKYGTEKYHLGKEGFYDSSYAIGFRRHFPHIKSFNKAIQQLLEGGILLKWQHDFVDTFKKKFPPSEKQRKIALGTEDLQSAFYVLCLGYGIATSTLIFEVLLYKCKKNNAV